MFIDRSKYSKKIIISLIILFGFGLSIWLSAPKAKPSSAMQKTEVLVDEVQTKIVSETQEIIGRVVSLEAGAIASEVSGIVKKVFVKPGDRVLKEQKITALDLERFKLAVKQNEAKLNAAIAKEKAQEIVVNQAELNFKRQSSLKQGPAFSKALYEDLQNKILEEKAIYDEAKANSLEAKANLDIANLNLERATIKAPYPGIITQKYIHPGVIVNQGTQIVDLINEETKEIEVDVPRNLLDSIEEGNSLTIVIDSKNYYAKVRKIIFEENTLSRTITVRLSPSKELKEKLVINQSVIVLLNLKSNKEVLSVHKDGLINFGTVFRVFVVNEENKVLPKVVVIGKQVGNRVEVKSGLSKGDLVVVKGNERLRPMQPVTYEIISNEPN